MESIIPNWKAVQDSRETQPEELDTTSSASVVYERRNIKRETVSVGNGEEEQAVSMWTYEQRVWPREEFLRMQRDMESPATRAIMQSISELQLEVAMSTVEMEG